MPWSIYLLHCRRRWPELPWLPFMPDNGWIGRYLEPLGVKVAFTPLGIVVALTFIGLPFVVRTLQPVIEDIEPEVEEAAASLGASRWQTFIRVLFPAHFPRATHRLHAGLFTFSRRVRIGHLHCRKYPADLGNHTAC
jgi:ABC-type sulfate transport system permease component